MKLFLLLVMCALFAVTFARTFEETMEPSPSEEMGDDDEEVCVDQAYLVSLGHSRRDMVHKDGIVATALCPGGSLPCGTQHHMVRVDGKAMSYGELCETRQCETKVMTVNSVYTHLWEEREHDGVVMTMFDRRYPEVGQMIAHWAVRSARSVMSS